MNEKKPSINRYQSSRFVSVQAFGDSLAARVAGARESSALVTLVQHGVNESEAMQAVKYAYAF